MTISFQRESIVVAVYLPLTVCRHFYRLLLLFGYFECDSVHTDNKLLCVYFIQTYASLTSLAHSLTHTNTLPLYIFKDIEHESGRDSEFIYMYSNYDLLKATTKKDDGHVFFDVIIILTGEIGNDESENRTTLKEQFVNSICATSNIKEEKERKKET